MPTHAETPIAEPTIQPEYTHGLGPVRNLRGFAVDFTSDVQYSYDAEGHLVGILERLGPGNLRFTPLSPPLGQTQMKGSTLEIVELPSDLLEIGMKLALPMEVVSFLLKRSAEVGETPNELMRKAVSLYKLATDAKQANLKVAIVDQDWQIDHEITGF